MLLPDLENLQDAARIIAPHLPSTPQFAWPLLAEASGAQVWVKHENHHPIGAFKVRGGLVYCHRMLEREPGVTGIVSATRGNHGQSLGFAARAAGLKCVIIVPHGNSKEKNAAMRAFGAELIEHGQDFDEARVLCDEIAEERGLHLVPSFHSDLVAGVGTYGLEFLSAVADLDAVYVPIGMGSGMCGLMAARDALGLKTKIVGVVAENAAAYALSIAAGRAIETNSARTFADGMAVRIPHPEALDLIITGGDHVVTVSDDEIAEAMRLYYRSTHNLAEGAGAAPLAALMQERATMAGQNVGVILSGGNVDREWFSKVLSGQTPTAT